MRSRDMFLAGVITSPALEFGASQIITEGFAEEKETDPFSGQAKYMRYFNRILSSLGIPVQVTWRDKEEMDIVKDLLDNCPDWLPHVYNCFAAPCYTPNLRRAWAKRAPTFPLYDSQCGSCVKCRITNVARVLYDPTMETVKEKDIKIFLENTGKWIRTNRIRLAELIEGSFLRDFKAACKKFDVQ